MPVSSGPIAVVEFADGRLEVDDDRGDSLVMAESPGLPSTAWSTREISGIVNGTLFASSGHSESVVGKYSPRSSTLDDNGDVVLLLCLEALNELVLDVFLL